MDVREAESDADILASFDVMSQLRPHLDRNELLARVKRQHAEGYRLVTLVDDGRVVAAAGYRLAHSLMWGRYVYVDDLVTDESSRSRGCGGRLLEWLIDEARRLGCDELHLDSGVQRFAAHRFYLRHRMDITSHHFALKLK